MRVAVAGATGRLGAPVCTAIEAAEDLTLVARIARSLDGAGYGCHASVAEALAASTVDVLVDLTQPAAVAANVGTAIDAGVACVIGTTGLSAPQQAELGARAKARGVALFYGPNFAIGAVLMMQFAVEAARHLPACAIVEEHADTKLDRPSGTALHTADLIEATGARRPEISSLRLPGLVANQAVVFGADAQTLTLRHDTTSREAFVPGVLLAIRRLATLPVGLTVGLDQLL